MLLTSYRAITIVTLVSVVLTLALVDAASAGLLSDSPKCFKECKGWLGWLCELDKYLIACKR